MSKFTESELERIRSGVPLVRVMEDGGIELKRQGKDYVCHCPFHEDKTPSLVVTPSKNLFHCFGCGVGGGVIDWVMKTCNIPFHEAVEQLAGDVSLAAKREVTAPVVAIDLEANEQTALDQVIDYYHQTLKSSPEALNYLASRGLNRLY
jgi:DNA primase